MIPVHSNVNGAGSIFSNVEILCLNNRQFSSVVDVAASPSPRSVRLRIKMSNVFMQTWRWRPYPQLLFTHVKHPLSSWQWTPLIKKKVGMLFR